jgi:nucleoside-diphosphate-sugar epimerase
MRIAVTGATGFIGGALLEALLAAGHEAVAATRRAIPATKKPGLSWVTLDLNSDSNLDEFLSGVDAVVNCASPTASEFAAAPEVFGDTYLAQVQRLAAAAVRAETALFIQLSTAQVHGLTAPAGRGDKSSVEISKYGLAHSRSERALDEIFGPSSTVLVIARLSNAFGWNPDLGAGSWNLFVNQLVMDAARGKPIQLRGGRASKRDFIPVADVVTVIMRMLNSEDLQKLEGVWQIGSGVCRTLAEVVETLQAQVSAQRSLEVHWSAEALADELCNDISRAEQAGLIDHSDFASELKRLFLACEAVISNG